MAFKRLSKRIKLSSGASIYRSQGRLLAKIKTPRITPVNEKNFRLTSRIKGIKKVGKFRR